MKYGIAFLLVAMAGVYVAAYAQGLGYLLLWPAASFALVAAAYFGLGPAVFGKRANGTLHPISMFVLLPYLIFAWSVWRMLRIVRSEPPWQQLSSQLWIGRRLLTRELPREIELVVDLTCEFAEPAGIRRRTEYLCLPTLDGMPPRLPELIDLTKRLAATDKSVYIHCAEGHGRTGVVAAALLSASGQAANIQEALARVQAARPKVRLSSSQLQILRLFEERWPKQLTSP